MASPRAASGTRWNAMERVPQDCTRDSIRAGLPESPIAPSRLERGGTRSIGLHAELDPVPVVQGASVISPQTLSSKSIGTRWNAFHSIARAARFVGYTPRAHGSILSRRYIASERVPSRSTDLAFTVLARRSSNAAFHGGWFEAHRNAWNALERGPHDCTRGLIPVGLSDLRQWIAPKASPQSHGAGTRGTHWNAFHTIARGARLLTPP
jgi:hypothetical protein